ncbi:hypothetical protein [Hymenobacter daeguensis]
MRTIVPLAPHNQPNPLEAALLQGIAEFYRNDALAAQISQCRVTLREYSGCGFFTTLVVPDDSPGIDVGKPYLNGCDVEAAGLSHGAGSILFVRDGRLDFLEVFAYLDGDPAALHDFTLKPMTLDAPPCGCV